MKLKTLTKVALAGLLVAGLAGGQATSAIAATKIIISNDTGGASLKGQTFETLKKELETRLGDKVDVELHHSGSLFDQKTQVQGLQLGSAHIISPTAGIYSPVAPKAGALLLPFLLSSPEAIDAALKDDVVRQAFAPDLESKNILPIAVWMNGTRNVGHKGKDAALTPDKWKGKKIRVQSAPIFLNTMKAIDANVVGMAWTEVPTALQTGVIDAAEPTLNAWVSSGNYQLVDHIILNHYIYSFYIVGANKQWWEGLSDEVRNGFQASLDAATKWNWENETKANEEALEKIKAHGTAVHNLTAEQRKAWQDAVAPVWKSMGEDVVGKEIMDRLREISAKYPPK